MKGIFYVLVLILVSLVGQSGLQAQCGGTGSPGGVTNSGTKFLLCFEQNNDVVALSGENPYLDIYMATLDDAIDTITITCRQYPTLNRRFILGARQSKVYRISDDTVQHHTPGVVSERMSNLWITSHEVADGRVVLVTATKPIVCYGMNFKEQTADAFMAYPEQSVGTEYRVISYPNSSGSDRPSQFAVAAFNDRTTVTIIPSVPTAGGVLAGQPIVRLLSAGECLQIQTNPAQADLDLTGSIVYSDQPVTVYGSHARAEVPHGFTTQQFQSRDHLTEALPPVSTWGKSFVVDAFLFDNAGNKRPEGDIVRVLALNDSTKVHVAALGWDTILMHDRHADIVVKDALSIEASGPVLVAELAHTSTTMGDQGDPFMAIIPPLDQTYNDFTFFASTDPKFTIQEVIIVTEITGKTSAKQDTSSIIIDNRQFLPTKIFKDLPGTVGGKRWAIAQVGVQPGPHQLRSILDMEHGITITMYGMGVVVSYGYTASALLVPKRSMTSWAEPVKLGGPSMDVINYRNMLGEVLYLDSIVTVIDGPLRGKVHVATKEDLIRDLAQLPMGGVGTFHLVADRKIATAVTGIVKIYSHSGKWFGLEPTVTPFTINPESESGVSVSGQSTLLVANFPNPFTSSTDIKFSLAESADVAIEVYDALGRVVRTIAERQEFSAGEHKLRFDRGNLPAGMYTYEIASSKLGLKDRHTMILLN